jgi:hypothetical protein
MRQSAVTGRGTADVRRNDMARPPDGKVDPSGGRSLPAVAGVYSPSDVITCLMRV